MNCANTNVLLTGGAKGIGRHLVERLAGVVRAMAVFDKDAAALSGLAAAIPTLKCYTCDVTDPAAVAANVATLERDGFQLDVLVNNAGLIHSAPLVNVLEKTGRVHSAEVWRQVIDANLSSTFYVTSHVVDHMLRRRKKGVVINISSVTARGNPGQSAYAAAKAGVNSLTRTWANELGVFGIRFVAIAPGFLETPSTREALGEAMLAKVKEQVPLRRLGEPEHIFQTVRFIIENDYLNGTVLEVDGGWATSP